MEGVDRSDALNSFLSIFVYWFLEVYAGKGKFFKCLKRISYLRNMEDRRRGCYHGPFEKNLAVELMILVAAILKIRGLVKTTKQTSQNY